MVFSHALRAFPEKIGQAEKQNVVFEGNHYFLSPYKTGKQTTTVKLASATVESYSKLKPSSQDEETITYGPYENIAPLQKSNMKIHYENNSPFLTVVNMVRTIEVSHWGNIAVEETFHVKHTGAELKGTFSRYDYQRSQTFAVIKSFKSVLPASAADVYYRDEIGNISTSNLLAMDDSVELEIRPRFPLFGGWQTRYYTGYNVPSYQYLFNTGSFTVVPIEVFFKY
ncbi:Dolichyl-diphosphooligosaccharide--glycosyltransferase subunit 1 [Paramuricea clavata]|uniref:Dolichyl-diphosphooligosaccharide--protein glycosyltransferase subunit 1 n=2 Tax=Paramuricea clavata TaxID=317549 RepID=A0A7D9K5L8_PARCT|nr:Dolichyl-diphosphooligosaccharide--glycosyltransferase subunit 1 [Paramuricea clavata]